MPAEKKSRKERRRDALEAALEAKIQRHEIRAAKTFSRTGHQMNQAAGAEKALEKLRAKRAKDGDA
jgi:hypothetical protein